jgi:hypothetical protein
MSMADEIVSKTKELAFKPDDLSDPFTNHGGGGHQTVEAAQNGSGKELQESYRSGFGESAKYTEKVTGR